MNRQNEPSSKRNKRDRPPAYTQADVEAAAASGRRVYKELRVRYQGWFDQERAREKEKWYRDWHVNAGCEEWAASTAVIEKLQKRCNASQANDNERGYLKLLRECRRRDWQQARSGVEDKIEGEFRRRVRAAMEENYKQACTVGFFPSNPIHI
ncbi:hypothetical protein JCM10908_007297 [Rhodotorula pacifica]|uniref:uncharacterized protein n=1 Tax=Rhodotorula pacifica TaxID=1495444 RepID=UPI003175B4D2